MKQSAVELTPTDETHHTCNAIKLSRRQTNLFIIFHLFMLKLTSCSGEKCAAAMWRKANVKSFHWLLRWICGEWEKRFCFDDIFNLVYIFWLSLMRTFLRWRDYAQKIILLLEFSFLQCHQSLLANLVIEWNYNWYRYWYSGNIAG